VTWSGLIIPILNGGDHFGSHRFYQAIHPVLMLNIIFLGSQIAQTVACLPFPSSSFRTLKLLVLSSVALLFLVSKSTDWFYFKTTSGFRREFFIAQSQRKFGEFMTNFFAKLPKYPSVGVVVAGGVKYTYQGPIFDLMGINNVVMGHYPGDRKGMKNHAAFEKNVLFAFPPDIVTPAYANLEQQPFQYDPLAISQSWDNQYPLKGLYDDSRFQQLFPFARISINSPDTNRAIMGFFHQEFISYIAQNPDYKVEFAKKISRSSH